MPIDKIRRVAVDGLIAVPLAIQEASKIWDVPPWEDIEAALKGDSLPIFAYLLPWQEKKRPRGPTAVLKTIIRAGKVDRTVEIITESSSRRIKIDHSGFDGDLRVEFHFGDEGSIFAAGDLYAHLVETEICFSVKLTNGERRPPTWRCYPGMSRDWKLANAYRKHTITEAGLEAALQSRRRRT